MKRPKFTILVAADDANVRAFIRQTIEATKVEAQVRLVSCGEEAIAYLKGKKQFADRQEYQYPSFLLTDLQMAPGDGFSVLNYLRGNPESAIIPTVVLAGSKDVNDIKTAYMLGASAYLLKPAQPDEFARLIHLLVAFWMMCEVPEVDKAGHRV